MHFNRLIILLFVNILFSQAYYESAIGVDYSSYSARSLSLASSSQISEVGAYCLLFNPSNITHNNGFSLSISNLIDSRFERRGLVVKDSFGDFLAESDYVKNSSMSNKTSFGIKYSKDITNRLRFGAAFSFSPYKSYDFMYEEEVRGQLQSNDGQIFSRDPLLGYHILESNGTQNLMNIGSAATWKIDNNFYTSFGFSYNIVMGADVNERAYVDTLSLIGLMLVEDSNELSDLEAYDINYKLNELTFLSYGMNVKYEDYLFSFSYQGKGSIGKVFKSSNNDYLNLFNSVDSLYGANELGLNLLSDYFGLKNNDIEKPTKINIGFSTINNQKNSFGLIFNYEINNYTEESSLKDNQRFSLGVEHYTINQIPIRFGLEYRTSEFSALSSATSFSAGSGFKLYGFSFDYGIKYKHAKYSFPDIFPVEGEFRPDLDIINDSNIIFLGTLTYVFK